MLVYYVRTTATEWKLNCSNNNNNNNNNNTWWPIATWNPKIILPIDYKLAQRFAKNFFALNISHTTIIILIINLILYTLKSQM